MTAPTLDRAAELLARGEEIAAEARAQGVFLCPVCIGPLWRDGMCRGCERETDAAYRTYRRALAAEDEVLEAFGEPGWEGRRYTDEDRRRDELTVARYERAWDLAGRDAETPKNGCATCGALRRGHDVTWRGGRRHAYVSPDAALRELRVQARHDLRDGRLWLAVGRRFEALGGSA